MGRNKVHQRRTIKRPDNDCCLHNCTKYTNDASSTAAAARVKKERDGAQDACYGQITSTTTIAPDTGSITLQFSSQHVLLELISIWIYVHDDL
jgi:hypothetical protein